MVVHTKNTKVTKRFLGEITSYDRLFIIRSIRFIKRVSQKVQTLCVLCDLCVRPSGRQLVVFLRVFQRLLQIKPLHLRCERRVVDRIHDARIAE